MERKKKIAFATLGCRYNRLESAELAYELDKAGYAQAERGANEPADVVVINSCAVTSKSAARCRAAIRDAREKNPGAKVVVTGCYSETSPEAVAAVEGVDLVLGNTEKFSVAESLKRLETSGANGPLVLADHGPMPAALKVRPVTGMAGRTNAYLNVQSGCDEICSFCIVKVARGRSRSASSEELVSQADNLCRQGIKEIVLSGINIGQYKDGAVDLAGLVRIILARTSIPRLRLSSINPNNITDDIVRLMAEEPRFMPHLHIPLQSGADKILKLMRRPYTASFYSGLLDRLAQRVEGIGLGADVMTGFPGETEKEFEQTRELVEKSPLMMLHVFSYSHREGTEAAGLPGAAPREEAKRRTNILKGISASKRRSFMQSLEGQKLCVLVETSRTRDGLLKGFTENYIPATFCGSDSLKNSIVRVEGTGAGDERLECRTL